MTNLPTFDERVAAIEEESTRLAEVVADDLDAPVPSCPDWSARDLAEHVASVFTFWSHQLASGDPTERHEPPRFEPGAVADAVGWLDASTGILVEALSDLGPDEPCWNWSGNDLDSNWVARRMALEVAVHRYDGELAAADPHDIAVPLSVDGIDERIDVHLRCDIPDYRGASLGGPICLSCNDTEAAWVVDVGGGKLRYRRGAGPAAAVVRGSASRLFLFTWNRIGLEGLDLTGDRAVAEAWATLPV
jgi:uncharacterized protein (TIGR03083 family)